MFVIVKRCKKSFNKSPLLKLYNEFCEKPFLICDVLLYITSIGPISMGTFDFRLNSILRYNKPLVIFYEVKQIIEKLSK